MTMTVYIAKWDGLIHRMIVDGGPMHMQVTWSNIRQNAPLKAGTFRAEVLMFTWIDQSKWPDLYRLVQPGREPDGYHFAQGYVLADFFDTFLRRISAGHLTEAWAALKPILAEYDLLDDDLSWGWLHSNHARVRGLSPLERQAQNAPHLYLGLISLNYQRVRDSAMSAIIDGASHRLLAAKPPFRAVDSFRSLKWNIAPYDANHALQLCEMMCLGEVSDWHPALILQDAHGELAPWNSSRRLYGQTTRKPSTVPSPNASQLYRSRTPNCQTGLSILSRRLGRGDR